MRLYDTLPQSEKNLILKFDKDAKKILSERDKCTFEPKINYSAIQARTKTHNIKSKAKPPLTKKTKTTGQTLSSFFRNEGMVQNQLSSRRDVLPQTQMQEKLNIHLAL